MMTHSIQLRYLTFSRRTLSIHKLLVPSEPAEGNATLYQPSPPRDNPRDTPRDNEGNPLSPQEPKDPRRDWYSISVDTLRGWGRILLGLAVLGLLYFAYRAWDQRDLERRSRELIVEDTALVRRCEQDAKLGEHRLQYDGGWQSLQQAKSEWVRHDFAAALASARRSHNLLQSILDALASPGAGQASFIAVQGSVEYRRGEGGTWEEARARVPLRAGDYVRTGDGASADVMFADGTLYNVRSNTQIIVSRGSGDGGEPGGGGEPASGGQAIQMKYGWVELATASRGSEVKTSGATARVNQDSEAFVTIDKDGGRGRFGAFRGGMELATPGGQTRQLKELQQVTQTGDLLSAPERLPGRPDPVRPADNLEVDLDQVQTLVLEWRPVPSSARYALQVSRTHLFVDNLVNVENRAKTRATLGLRGEGTFYWRVAAFARGGAQGPWSKPQKFRLAAARSAGGDKPQTPPELDLEDVKSYGNIFIVAGRTDPGSRIEVNGEQVNVGVDGSFTKTVQLTKDGWALIEVRARDRWGSETRRRRRVFVEGP
jgi:hypothetical protein